MTFSCIPKLADGCMCAHADEVVEDSDLVAALADDLLRRGHISEREHTELVKSDRVYREEHQSRVLRPPRSSRRRCGRASPLTPRSSGSLPLSPMPPPPPPLPPASLRCPDSQFVGSVSTPKVPAPGTANVQVDGPKPKAPAPGPPATGASKKKEKEGQLGERDPITLEPLVLPWFTFQPSEQAASTTRYNIASLVQYMVSSGDFREPITRLAFTDDQLKELDTLAKQVDPSLPSVVQTRGQKSKFQEQRLHRDLVEGIERCLSEVLVGIIEVIDTARGEEDGHLALCTKFHEFDFYLDQLSEVDSCAPTRCLQQFQDLVLGPPNKRRRDKHGLGKVVLSFLRDKARHST